MNFYNNNIDILKKIDFNLFNKISKTNKSDYTYNIVKTKANDYTLEIINNDILNNYKCFLHSKYNPQKEATLFANAQLDNKACVNIVYGFGLGYHIEEILKKLDKNKKLYVVDINLEVFKLALKLRNLSEILLDNRLKLIISDDEKYLSSKLKGLLIEGNKFFIHPASIKTIPNRYDKFKFAIENWNIKKSLTDKWVNLLSKNFEKNKSIKCENIGVLFNKYKNIPIVIVSAGPSLNKNKQLLHNIKNKAFIFAVGSALKPLLEIGFKPNMFCIIDPQEITYNQIEGYENLDIPLVFLDTASSYTVSRYLGPKYVVCNDINRIKNKDYLIDSGGSVATAVMDIAIKFGGNPIVFIGQDLAYTNNQHHAKGDMYGEEEKVKSLPNMRKVKGQNGEILNTTLGLLSFKYWIENKIKDTLNVDFINCTEEGAFIDGCKHIKLEDFIEEYILKERK
ncbi:motility associated factor glycosyltransferase family protein [Tepidibacter mesophilus]|uniref:motility associated factor glycosyltransferase family protein n=1 Tax=Tepidibacter mesophilus TaxID=655607 RepID=UPI000C08A85B|nr:6-hydroxymethylpterin diphosphokinase MptE-like protein [Tepidibacter mesophilus]